MEPVQLACKEVNTQEVLLVLFSIYSQGMVMFIVAEENPQALFLNDSPENRHLKKLKDVTNKEIQGYKSQRVLI